MSSTADTPPAAGAGGPPPPSPPPEPPAADSRHEPAVRPWEQELLISGAVVFALFQFPPLVDRWFDGVDVATDGLLHWGAFFLYYYSKLILYVLIPAFVLHVCGRAYWVGLIGLESVFPQGIRWDEGKLGPIASSEYRRRLGRIQPMIDRADRFCSVIFSFSFALVAFFLVSIVLVGVMGALGYGVSRLFFGGRWVAEVAAVILYGLLGLSTAAALLDRHLGRRLRPEGRAHRALRRVIVANYYVLAMPFTTGVWLVLASNLSRRRIGGATVLVVVSVFGVFLGKDVLLRRNFVRVDAYAYLPLSGARAVAPMHYDNLRAPDDVEAARVPSIQGDVVEGTYVRLFVPYLPRRANEAVQARCPGLPKVGGTGVRRAPRPADSVGVATQDRVLGCLAALYPVRLNGQPVQPRFRFSTHPGSGARGLVAYLPTEGLPAGENLLEVGAPPRRRGGEWQERPPYQIPFWR